MSRIILPFFLLSVVIFWNACQLSPETYKEGKILYMNNCASCHGESMQGLGKIYPSLINLDSLQYPVDDLICLISKGSKQTEDSLSTGELISLPMPAFPKLSAIQINNILNYLNAQYWKMEPFQLDQTVKVLSSCEEPSKSETQQQ